MKNLQGDIIAIADKNGKTVVTYNYDAWGKCTITKNTAPDGNLAVVNPYRYRGYYYDRETGLYYLQSRYYNPEMGRFVNEDEAICVLISFSSSGENLFTYCHNKPVNMEDQTGFYAQYVVALIGKFVALCAVTLVAYHLLVATISTPSFQKSWATFCTEVGNGLSWLGNAIVSGGRAAWNFSVAQILMATAALENYKNFVQSEINIRRKIKRNSKSRYWVANVINIGGYKYATISSPISFRTAQSLASVGRSIFAVTKYEARTLAQRFSEISGPELGQRNKCCKQYWHYHILNKRFRNQHIFYLF